MTWWSFHQLQKKITFGSSFHLWSTFSSFSWLYQCRKIGSTTVLLFVQGYRAFKWQNQFYSLLTPIPIFSSHISLRNFMQYYKIQKKSHKIVGESQRRNGRDAHYTKILCNSPLFLLDKWSWGQQFYNFFFFYNFYISSDFAIVMTAY